MSSTAMTPPDRSLAPLAALAVCAGCDSLIEAAEQSAQAPHMTLPRSSSEPVAAADVIDLFSGCGGLSSGFAMLSSDRPPFRLAGAFDVNLPALETYRANLRRPAIALDLAAAVSGTTEWRAFQDALDRRPGNPLVLVGGPPCQGFSAHRKRERGPQDGRNSLIAAFAEIAVRLQPDAIVLENVPELLATKYWQHFAEFRESLESAGYTVQAQIHNLAGFGVPQERFRALVVATRGPASLPQPFLAPEQYRTVRDAIGHLPVVAPGEVCSDDVMHYSTRHRRSTLEVIAEVPLDGGNRPKGVGPACLQKVDGFRDVYGRLALDKPANTITAYARNPASGRFVHPLQNRGLTIREAALLQGFPDDYQFSGNFDSKFSQIGNAVPPRFATVLAAHVARTLHGCMGKSVDDPTLVLSPQRNSFSSSLAGLKRLLPA